MNSYAQPTPPSRRVLPPSTSSPAAPVPPASPARQPAPLPEAAAMLRRSVTRDAVGQRLRINGALLFGFYIASRSTRYANAAAHLLALLPALDAPLHWLESAALLLLCYNILEALYRLNGLSTILPPPPPSPSTPLRPTASLHRSSPKTRPSPSPTATRSLVKSESPLKSVSPLRLSSPSLRHSTTPAASTPNRRRSLLSTSTSTPLPSSLVTPIKHDESPQQPILTAFMVRHSPVASTFHRSISDRQSIDSLFEPRASM